MLNQISPVTIKDGICYQTEKNVEFSNPPVYEVIRVINGMPLYFNEHADRLFNSLALSHIESKVHQSDLLAGIETLVKETGIINNNVRLEVGESHTGAFTWVLFWVKSQYPDKEVYLQGVKTVTSNVTRNNPHAKIYRKDYVDSINLLKQQTGAYEVILIKENDIVTEGSRSNLFFIKNGKLYAASEKDVLMGITREKLLKLLSALSIERIEMDIKVDTIQHFEACFLTGTSIHLLPIKSINDTHYNSASHPLFIKLKTAFEKIVKDDLEQPKGGTIK